VKEVKAPDLTERERVELIVKAFVFCRQELAEGDISDQFRRETNERPDRKVVLEVLEKWKGREE
jgi:hypothetical protein